MNQEKKEYKWYELRRENWWDPYTWERTGIGMSRSYDKDCSEEYKIKRRRLKALKIYGLEKNDIFLPMIVCLQFHRRSLVFDRAIHNLGNMRFFNIETAKEVKKDPIIPYTTLSKDGSDYNTESFNQNIFPFDKSINQLEKIVEEYSSTTVSKFIIHGNKTLAVGLLINGVTFLFKEKLYLRMGNVKLDKDKISKTLGRKTSKDLSSLYVLHMELGKYK